MAKTQDNSTLATFRIDADKWESFKAKCSDRNDSASKVLKDFIDSYLNDSSSLSIQSPIINIDSSIDNCIETLNDRIDARYSDLSEMVNNAIASLRDEFEQRLSALPKGLGEYAPQLPTPTTSPETDNQLSVTNDQSQSIYSETELQNKTNPELKQIIADLGLDLPKNATKANLIKNILSHDITI